MSAALRAGFVTFLTIKGFESISKAVGSQTWAVDSANKGAWYHAGRVAEKTYSGKGFATLVFSQSVFSGVSSVLGGGKFGHGFATGFATKLSGAALGGVDTGLAIEGIDVVQVTAAAIVGGTVSKLSGGKFANGAVTAAFLNIFNQNSSNNRQLAQKKTIDDLYADGTLSDEHTFSSQKAAAKHVLSGIADIGEALNVEFAGDIVSAGLDANGNPLFGYTRPQIVGVDGGNYTPESRALSSYHNHNGGQGHSPKFSPDDVVWVQNTKINMFMMNKTYGQFRVCEYGSYRCSGPGGATRKGTVLEF